MDTWQIWLVLSRLERKANFYTIIIPILLFVKTSVEVVEASA